MHKLIESLPKTELHLHIEGGSMYPDLALELSEKNKVPLPFDDLDSAKAYYAFSSLDHFIDILRTTVATLCTAEDYARCVNLQGAHASQQNIHYHEIMVCPGLRPEVPFAEIVEGLRVGRENNLKKYNVETRFIIDIDRTKTADYSFSLVKEAAYYKERCGLIAIGLDCQENGFPPGRHQEAFSLARKLGFRLTGHCGEDGPPAYSWEGLKECGLERIDHGVRAFEDPKLVQYLAEQKVPLTVCPISNIALKVFPTIAQHSILQLHRAGVCVTINSDDPPMFGCKMTDDFKAVAHFDLPAEDIIQMARNGFEASFMEPGEKATALRTFDDFARKLIGL